jgi:phage shock protein A
MSKEIIEKIIELHEIIDELKYISKNRKNIEKAIRINETIKKADGILGIKNNIISLTKHLQTLKSIDLKFDIRTINKLNRIDIEYANKVIEELQKNKTNFEYIKPLNFKLQWFTAETVENISYIVKNINPRFINKLDNLIKKIENIENTAKDIGKQNINIQNARKELYILNEKVEKTIESLNSSIERFNNSTKRLDNIKPILKIYDGENKAEYNKDNGELTIYLKKQKIIKEKEIIHCNSSGSSKEINRMKDKLKGYRFFAIDTNELYIKKENKKNKWEIKKYA